jgi:hypothetical protein
MRWPGIGRQWVTKRGYHQRGRIAEERLDFAGAAAWYNKSLAIEERQGDGHRSASNYGQLGHPMLEQADFAGAGTWFLKAAGLFAKVNDPHYLSFTVDGFLRSLQAADAAAQARLLLGNGLVTAEGQEWQRLRDLVQPAFKSERLEHYLRTMAACTEELLQEWRSLAPGQPLDLARAMTRLTLAIVGRTLFGLDPGRRGRPSLSGRPEGYRCPRAGAAAGAPFSRSHGPRGNAVRGAPAPRIVPATGRGIRPVRNVSL